MIIYNNSCIAFMYSVFCIANSEIFLGTLLRTATAQTPMLAKAWLNSATWFYKWGRKIIDTIRLGVKFLFVDLNNSDSGHWLKITRKHIFQKSFHDQ